ncbi:hypothetical protein HYW55_05690 [Candidatus Gottesmanbacteria bacterium]|nr:hypothetical protein [Candidatus Gottesmanbacteria bacterium]
MATPTKSSSPIPTENLNEILLSWKSPSHPFKKRNKVFYQTVAAITFLLVVIVFFLHEFMLIGVILSIAFVVYVTSTVEPIEVSHKVTPLGFEQAEKLIHWGQCYAFWFEEKWGSKMLVIQTRLAFPAQVRAVLGDVSEQKIKDVIGKYLLYMEKPPKSWTDSFSHWLSKKFPLETTV